MSDYFGTTAYRGLLPFMDEEEEEKPEANYSFTFGETAAGNQAGVIVGDDVNELNVSGGGGTQFIDIRADVNGGDIDLGGGDDAVVIRGGSVLDGVDFGLGEGDDYFTQKAGATFRNVDVRGEDGSDRLEFAGHNEGTYVNPGRNKEKPDVIIFHDTVTGDIDLADPENWKAKPKDDTEWGKDVVMLAGDWKGRDGDRYNTNLFGGGGEKAYSGFQRMSGGRIAADIDIKGDVTKFEYVARIDEHGQTIGTLQSIEPEMVYENMWAKYTGQALVVAGSVIPGAQFLIPIGLGVQMAFEADNKILSWESAALTVAQGAADVSGVGWLSRGVRAGTAAYQGDYIGAAIGGASAGASGFLSKGSGWLHDGLQATSLGYGGYRAAERGDIAGVIASATSIPGALGVDSSGWIARGGSIAADGYGFGAAVAEGDVDGILNYGSKLPHGIGIDDDRTVMAVGDYLRTVYRIGSFEFGQKGNDVVTDVLDLVAGNGRDDPGVVQGIVRGNEHLAYQAPPDLEMTEDGRLVLANPEDLPKYLEYVEKFRDDDGRFDFRALEQEIGGSHLNELERNVLFGNLRTQIPQPPPELSGDFVVLEGTDPDGKVGQVRVPEEHAEAYRRELENMGIRNIEVLEPPEERVEASEESTEGRIDLDEMSRQDVDTSNAELYTDPDFSDMRLNGSTEAEDASADEREEPDIIPPPPIETEDGGRSFAFFPNHMERYLDAIDDRYLSEEGFDRVGFERELERSGLSEGERNLLLELGDERFDPVDEQESASVDASDEQASTVDTAGADFAFVDTDIDFSNGLQGDVDTEESGDGGHAGTDDVFPDGTVDERNGTRTYQFSSASADEEEWDSRRVRIRDEDDREYTYASSNPGGTLTSIAQDGSIAPEDIVAYGGPDDIANDGVLVELDEGTFGIFRDPENENTLLAAQEAGIDFEDIRADAPDGETFFNDDGTPVEEIGEADFE